MKILFAFLSVLFIFNVSAENEILLKDASKLSQSRLEHLWQQFPHYVDIVLEKGTLNHDQVLFFTNLKDNHERETRYPLTFRKMKVFGGFQEVFQTSATIGSPIVINSLSLGVLRPDLTKRPFTLAESFTLIVKALKTRYPQLQINLIKLSKVIEQSFTSSLTVQSLAIHGLYDIVLNKYSTQSADVLFLEDGKKVISLEKRFIKNSPCKVFGFQGKSQQFIYSSVGQSLVDSYGLKIFNYQGYVDAACVGGMNVLSTMSLGIRILFTPKGYELDPNLKNYSLIYSNIRI